MTTSKAQELKVGVNQGVLQELVQAKLPQWPNPGKLSEGGFCAAAALELPEGHSLAECLERFPAKAALLIQSDTCNIIKPEGRMTSEDSRQCVEGIAGVYLKMVDDVGTKAMWWTTLGGVTVQVHLRGDYVQELIALNSAVRQVRIDNRYTALVGVYEPVSVALRKSALNLWIDSWQEFSRGRGYLSSEFLEMLELWALSAARKESPSRYELHSANAAAFEELMTFCGLLPEDRVQIEGFVASRLACFAEVEKNYLAEQEEVKQVLRNVMACGYIPQKRQAAKRELERLIQQKTGLLIPSLIIMKLPTCVVVEFMLVERGLLPSFSVDMVAGPIPLSFQTLRAMA